MGIDLNPYQDEHERYEEFLTGKACWGHLPDRKRQGIFLINMQGQRNSGKSAGKN